MESDRLKSFKKWPLKFIDKNILAATGFVYTGTHDHVKCAFCYVEIGSWVLEDDLITEHSRWSPFCPLINRQYTHNKPIDAQLLEKILPAPRFETSGHVVKRRNTFYHENAISDVNVKSSMFQKTRSLISTLWKNILKILKSKYICLLFNIFKQFISSIIVALILK